MADLGSNIDVVAGEQNSPGGFVDGPSILSPKFNAPTGVCVSSNTGDIFVADRNNNAIRLIRNDEGTKFMIFMFESLYLLACLLAYLLTCLLSLR